MAVEKHLSAIARSGRVIIEGVRPEIDCGRFPIKRIQGEQIRVEADVFIEGHESLSCALLHRKKGASRWTEVPMEPLVNDRWTAAFVATELGRYQYTLRAWHDPFKGWRRDLQKRIDAEQDIAVDLRIGADLIDAAIEHAPAREAARLTRYAEQLRGDDGVVAQAAALDPKLAALMAAHTSRAHETSYPKELEVVVDPPIAGFSAWYELFPRSAAAEPGIHGTFKDVERWLPRIAALGFDVLYLPPIHPIGQAYRKGKNNTLVALADDVGSPWAIGSDEGGHKAVHRELGTLSDFKRLVKAAHEHGLEIALDIAFQASPDHPYVKRHPGWFRRRPDGTIQYAENPPKKYQDIYPFDFDSDDATTLWLELRSVFQHWIDYGVKVFRVDNPHTKPFSFWEWLITSIKHKHPEVIFLSEAFTRPKLMYRLAKLGYSQSYTYFAWRDHKADLIEYMTELTTTEVAEFFRPNFWPNTPDILTAPFAKHGRPMFLARLVLAATLTANYGIYGPTYERMEATPREPGSEEYLDSEKYQLRHWEFTAENSISAFIARVNRIRKENPALHSDRRLEFHKIENEQIIAYSKRSEDRTNVIVTVVNLDPEHTQSGWVQLPLVELGLPADEPFRVRDLLTDAVYEWRGAWNYVELNPMQIPAHIMQVERLA